MLCSLRADFVHFAFLWQYDLEAEVLLEACRGVLLLRLPMGLIRAAFVSLILVIGLCGSSLLSQ